MPVVTRSQTEKNRNKDKFDRLQKLRNDTQEMEHPDSCFPHIGEETTIAYLFKRVIYSSYYLKNEKDKEEIKKLEKDLGIIK